MTTSFLSLTLFVLFPFPIICSAQELLPYKNKKLPIETRVQDLLQRMTPEEKFMQLFMVPGDLDNNPDKYKNGIFGLQVNTISSNNNAAGQMMEYNPGRNATETAEKINSIQKYFVENLDEKKLAEVKANPGGSFVKHVKVGNEVIGAVGVGGAPGGHLDEACAVAGIDKVKELLK